MHSKSMFLKTLDGTKPHSAQVTGIRHEGCWSHGVIIARVAPTSIWWGEQMVRRQARTWTCLMLGQSGKVS
jgi:hypothetical protein